MPVVISATKFLEGDYPPGEFLVRTTDGVETDRRNVCRGKRNDCGKFAVMRYSLDLPAGRHCGGCWDKSGYRKEGRSGFDPTYAGESYEEDY